MALLSRLLRLPVTLDLRPWGGQRRWKLSGKVRYNDIRRRANEQHIDWLRQLDGPPKPYRQVVVDPKLQSHREDTNVIFNHPELTRQPSRDMPLLAPEAALAKRYRGDLGSADLEPHGRLEVAHGDVFQEQVDALLLPMAPNLMPYRGLGLEALDRGGKELVKQLFNEAHRAHGEDTGGLQAGDTLAVPGLGVAAERLLFVVMPWFWEGSPLDASKRLRHTVRRALLSASAAGYGSLALPHLGGGIFGYEPSLGSMVMMEESVEALMQLEAAVPNYSLQSIRFVEDRRETAEALQDALTEVVHRWLPERRVTTAPQWWSRASRRLLVLPDTPRWFMKIYRVKFKQFHGVKRKWRRNYKGNIKPFLWRAMRVHQPPPLRVYEASGEVAEKRLQAPGRPFFARGVSHWLFPSRRSGYHGLRKSSKGHWIGANGRYRLHEFVRPKS